MFKKLLFLAVFSLTVAFSKPVVITSIAPLAYFVEAIAGDSVEVLSLASGDVHTYEPKPNDMKNIAKASIFFATGVEFEKVWLDKFKANSKDLVIIQTDAKIAKLKSAHDHDEHDKDHDEHEKDHEMEAKDPHVWLNPMLALTQARSISDALIDAFPANRQMYLDNFQALMTKIIELDESAVAELKELKNRKFVVYHPAWAYFAAHYDLEQISIEIDGKEPKINDLANTIKLIKENNIKVIFADPNHSQKSARILAEQTGAKLELLDPLARNWYENLQSAIKAIKNAN